MRPFAPNPKWAEARIFIVGTNPATFRYLLDVCKPSVVLFHGSPAVGLAKAVLNRSLDPDQPTATQDTFIDDPIPCHLFAFPHFSGRHVKRGYRMDAELARLAERMKAIALQSNSSKSP